MSNSLTIKRIEKLNKKGVSQDCILRMMKTLEKKEEKEKKGATMERKYLKGFYAKKKESKYGHFYKCSIKYDEFLNDLSPNDKGYVNFCIFENKEGKPYAIYDEYAENKTPDNEVKKFNEDELPF